MSTDITKKQHYVWRKYLNAWKVSSNDADVWTGFLETNEVKKIALTSVAQSSYFYKLEELTNEEIDFLKKYSAGLSTYVKSIADTLIAGYILFSNIKREISKGKTKTEQSWEHEFKKIEINSFEKIQSNIELMGDELIKCKSIIEVEAITEEQPMDVLYYLWVQYTRTKSMKDRIVESMSERPHLKTIAQKCWPFFNFVTAMQLVESMVRKNDYRFVYVYNKSSIPFITGDQPVFNALADITDENGEVKEIELYYPLSPITALVISFTPGDKYTEINADEDYVKERNALIKKESQIHIFANEEKVLNNLLKGVTERGHGDRFH